MTSNSPMLPDILAENLKIVFCGTAASAISAREGAYYANPTNYFWRTLYDIGLTPRQLEPQDFPQVLQYGLGLTDIAKYASGQDAGLSEADFDADSLREKIEQYQPQILAFTSKRGAAAYSGLRTGQIDYGLQVDTIGSTRLWVLPSPSGAARRYWDIGVWQALSDFAASSSEGRASL